MTVKVICICRYAPLRNLYLDSNPDPLLEDAAQAGSGKLRPVVEGERALQRLHDPQLVRQPMHPPAQRAPHAAG